MRKRGALFANLSATVIGLSTLWSGVVVAANKCITEPKLQSVQGTHWYYHVDPVSHRKCWYVGRQKVPQAEPPESRSSPKPKSDDEASHRPGTRLDEAARDALFQEFLRWQERQNQPDSSPDQAARDALFREFVLWEVQHMDAER